MNRATIARPITATGTALHAGMAVTMTLSPAPPGAGVIFERSDIGKAVPARWDLVGETRLGTVIELDGALKPTAARYLDAARAQSLPPI